MSGNFRIHREHWTSAELEIVYLYYSKKTIREIFEMLPNRSFSAVKNKIKLVKFGKYKKRRTKDERKSSSCI